MKLFVHEFGFRRIPDLSLLRCSTIVTNTLILVLAGLGSKEFPHLRVLNSLSRDSLVLSGSLSLTCSEHSADLFVTCSKRAPACPHCTDIHLIHTGSQQHSFPILNIVQATPTSPRTVPKSSYGSESQLESGVKEGYESYPPLTPL
jgi:hypothetical protein